MTQIDDEILDQPSDRDNKPMHALSLWDAVAWGLILISWFWRLMHWPLGSLFLITGITILLIRSCIGLIRTRRRWIDWMFFAAQAALVLLLVLRLYSVALPKFFIYIILAVFLVALLLKTSGSAKKGV
jgi:hypothetical protein